MNADHPGHCVPHEGNKLKDTSTIMPLWQMWLTACCLHGVGSDLCDHHSLRFTPSRRTAAAMAMANMTPFPGGSDVVPIWKHPAGFCSHMGFRGHQDRRAEHPSCFRVCSMKLHHAAVSTASEANLADACFVWP